MVFLALLNKELLFRKILVTKVVHHTQEIVGVQVTMKVGHLHIVAATNCLTLLDLGWGVEQHSHKLLMDMVDLAVDRQVRETVVDQAQGAAFQGVWELDVIPYLAAAALMGEIVLIMQTLQDGLATA